MASLSHESKKVHADARLQTQRDGKRGSRRPARFAVSQCLTISLFPCYHHQLAMGRWTQYDEVGFLHLSGYMRSVQSLNVWTGFDPPARGHETRWV